MITERLIWLRKKNRYTQGEMAKNLKITASGYQKYEMGQSGISSNNLIKVCEFFNESADFMLGLTHRSRELEGVYKEYTVQDQLRLHFLSKLTLPSIESYRSNKKSITSERDSLLKDLDSCILTQKKLLLNYISVMLSQPVGDKYEDDLIAGLGVLSFHIDSSSNNYKLIIETDHLGLVEHDTYTSKGDAIADRDVLKEYLVDSLVTK